ncbi:MAG: M15 family metallopeptidase [Proteobacteria bacterium]|nr:M15 family metallopeptidase [Pseudomonadota bacterium]
MPVTRLSIAQLTGQDESQLVTLPCGNQMLGEAAQAFACLAREASEAGFELSIVSSFRSFERQAAIWNGKASGLRPLHDDDGVPLDWARLSTQQLLHAILRFSAAPGTSRHHWGTDIDVCNLAGVGTDYAVQLTPQEVAPGGVFDSLHRWLDQRMAADTSHGFFRPYAQDGGGVAVERWHLSYAPLSVTCAGQLSTELVGGCWEEFDGELCLRGELLAQLPEILQRYTAVAENWCPARYRRAH